MVQGFGPAFLLFLCKYLLVFLQKHCFTNFACLVKLTASRVI
jgi:hypothetical protein